PPQEAASFLTPIKRGKNAGVISEAGCPAVADPGANLVKMAHAQQIKVMPLVGPSSILLALMGSGFNGQSFAFHGYLPINKQKRQQRIQKLEQRSRKEGSTQLFMEAPHRNKAIVKDVLRYCNPQSRFCTATNLTLPDEQIISRPLSQWDSKLAQGLHKKPTIFLLSASNHKIS